MKLYAVVPLLIAVVLLSGCIASFNFTVDLIITPNPVTEDEHYRVVVAVTTSGTNQPAYVLTATGYMEDPLGTQPPNSWNMFPDLLTTGPIIAGVLTPIYDRSRDADIALGTWKVWVVITMLDSQGNPITITSNVVQLVVQQEI